jgi:hypothetical protein
LLVRDVTGDGQDDFVVPLAAASSSPYTVVSSDGGRWRQVPFGNEGQVIVREPDDPSVRTFVTSTNLCTPSCAAGHYRRDQWKYSSRDRRFLLASSAICDRTELLTGGASRRHHR